MVSFEYSDVVATTIENRLHNVTLEQASIHCDDLPLEWNLPQ